MKGNQEH